MNCQDYHEQLVPLGEGLLDDAEATALRNHLAVCPLCRAEHEATLRIRDRLMVLGNAPIQAGLEQAVIDRILVEQVELIRRLKMKKRIKLYAMAALAATVSISVTWAALYYGPAKAGAAEVLARGVEAASNLKSIYLKCRMRTLPGDNFEMLDFKHEFVDVELWKEFGPPLQWRIEKPGRVAAMNGHETMMLIGGRAGVKLDVATPSAFDTKWLHRLAAIDNMLSRELASVSLPRGTPKITRTEGPGDSERQTIVVQVETGDEVGPYLRNKILGMSNTHRVYTFDRKTGRLENAKFFCQSDGKDVLALEIVEIKYDPDIADSQFELSAPQGIAWYKEPQRLPDNEKYEKMTPVEAAQVFFQACSKRDWDEVAKFWTMTVTEELKQYLGGLEIISLGKPFQAKPYGGWFVPYEIKMSSGDVRKHNLALRNDNPAKRFVVDGGI